MTTTSTLGAASAPPARPQPGNCAWLRGGVTASATMGWRDSLFLLVSVIASVTGQFFMKRGAAKIGVATLGSLIQRILSIATTPDLLLGLGAYAIGAIAWILLLTRVPLSVAAPAGSLVYVLSVVIGRYAFNEPVPTTRVIGLLLIVVGVTLVAQRAAGAPVGG